MDDRQRVRYSFLVRREGLSAEDFRDHYEHTHGPLASSLSGFRRWTVRYDQNHVIEKIAGDWEVDGITATWQRHRPDYTVGFFQEPDYDIIRRDELAMLDVTAVRSVMGVRAESRGQGRGEKVLMMTSSGDASVLSELSGAFRQVRTDLDVTTTSALGAGLGSVSVRFRHNTLIEAWFPSVAVLTEAMLDVIERASDPVAAWRVWELTLLPT